MSGLDTILPSSDVRERHGVRLAVPPQQALAAVRAVAPAEAPLLRRLFLLRGLGRPSTPGAPVLDELLTNGFRVLVETDRELVVALVGQPWRLRAGLRPDVDFHAFSEPGYAKMAMSFAADGAALTTETRVLLTDAGAGRRFRVYWLVVRPFSGLVRRSWLAAAARRCQPQRGESSQSATTRRDGSLPGPPG